MAKNSMILSVSLPKEQAEFLDAQNLSISTLTQEKIAEQMRLFEVYNTDKAKLLKGNEGLQKEIQLLYKFLDYIGKEADWRKWRGENVLE